MGLRWWAPAPVVIGCLASCQTAPVPPEVPQITVVETRISQPLGVASTGKVGRPVVIGLMGGGADLCFRADRVEVAVDETAKVVTLKAYVKDVRTPTQACGQAVIDIPLVATFTPTTPGVYRIEARGWDTDDSREIVRTAEITITE